MIRRAERNKQRPIYPQLGAYDSANDGALDDAHYVAKLKRSKRPGKLTGAVLLLLLAVRRIPAEELDSLRLRVTLSLAVRLLAVELAAYVFRQTGRRVSSDALYALLLDGIIRHALKASVTLSGNALKARLGLIVQAEVQQATAAAVRSVSASMASITRETTSANPCDDCLSLAGTYYPPYPDDLWWSHPRCACVYS